jgi:hypothetical protein
MLPVFVSVAVVCAACAVTGRAETIPPAIKAKQSHIVLAQAMPHGTYEQMCAHLFISCTTVRMR